MKIKVPKIFNTTTMTDNEKLFCWFIGKFFDRYSWDQPFTMDAYDAKIILHSSTIRTFAASNIGDELPKYFKIAFYSDRRIGLQINKDTLAILKRRHMSRGEIKVGTYDVEITQPTTILIYSYLMGILGFMQKWTYESESVVGFSDADLDETLTATEAMRNSRITDPFELQQLLNELA